jgi:hypothetical protein
MKYVCSQDNCMLPILLGPIFPKTYLIDCQFPLYARGTAAELDIKNATFAAAKQLTVSGTNIWHKNRPYLLGKILYV